MADDRATRQAQADKNAASRSDDVKRVPTLGDAFAMNEKIVSATVEMRHLQSEIQRMQIETVQMLADQNAYEFLKVDWNSLRRVIADQMKHGLTKRMQGK